MPRVERRRAANGKCPVRRGRLTGRVSPRSQSNGDCVTECAKASECAAHLPPASRLQLRKSGARFAAGAGESFSGEEIRSNWSCVYSTASIEAMTASVPLGVSKHGFIVGSRDSGPPVFGSVSSRVPADRRSVHARCGRHGRVHPSAALEGGVGKTRGRDR